MAHRLDRSALPWSGVEYGTRFEATRRPIIGVMCCNGVVDARRAQTVASRFVEPLACLSDVSVMLVPAIEDAVDALTFASLFDGLLLTGACSNVAAARYGGGVALTGEGDAGRDAVALTLAACTIEAGRPVFGICRGLQELNVLFGGTLAADVGDAGHHHAAGDDRTLAELFDHRHAIEVIGDGLLASAIGPGSVSVNSVHRQGIDRLGTGLTIEAIAPEDGLVEAVSARPCGAPVLGVQWHPEWDVAVSASSRSFFDLVGRVVRDPTRPLQT